MNAISDEDKCRIFKQQLDLSNGLAPLGVPAGQVIGMLAGSLAAGNQHLRYLGELLAPMDHSCKRH